MVDIPFEMKEIVAQLAVFSNWNNINQFFKKKKEKNSKKGINYTKSMNHFALSYEFIRDPFELIHNL